MEYRIEKDSMGNVKVPENKYWGAQTQRSLENFKISDQKMPREVIESFSVLKEAAAKTNYECNIFSKEKMEVITQVCEEIREDKLAEHFPLVVWQTGSGTQSNMNVNEVIANRGHVLHGGKLQDEVKFLHPNDDVNKSQSSNDTFPTAMNIASYRVLHTKTLPSLEKLQSTLEKKSKKFKDIIKIGRTHFMDATPLTLGQEFSGYASQIEHGVIKLRDSMQHLQELALGGTAVGTGINTPKGYSTTVAKYISQLTGLPFISAINKFESLAANDAIVSTSGALKTLAVSLMKIANDIRMLASGPRSGIGEIYIPANEPGSSIMPGKVNPTQCEALTMVCAQVIGNDVAISIGGMNGHFELNVFKPMIIFNFLMAANNMADAVLSFTDNCVVDIEPNLSIITKNLENSLMLVTALNTHIGYDNAAKIAKKAYSDNTTLKVAALKLDLLTEAEFDQWVKPENMIGNNP